MEQDTITIGTLSLFSISGRAVYVEDVNTKAEIVLTVTEIRRMLAWLEAKIEADITVSN